MGSMTYFSARLRGRVANLIAYRCDMGPDGISDTRFTRGTVFDNLTEYIVVDAVMSADRFADLLLSVGLIRRMVGCVVLGKPRRCPLWRWRMRICACRYPWVWHGLGARWRQRC